MIIKCNNCNKKFKIDADLIPKEGRLLQCSSCNHKWFFKKEELPLPASSLKKENPTIFESKKIEKNTALDDNKNVNFFEKNSNHDKITPSNIVLKKNKSIKTSNFLKLIIVITISFIALIILIDTFKYPLNSIFPNIEFLLYNLYESIKDMWLFFKDLI